MTMPWEDYQSNASAGPWLDYKPNTYSQNVGQDWANTEQKIGEKWQSSQTLGGLNPASAGVQTLSDAATGAYAPLIEGVKSGYKSLPSDITQPINNAASSAMQSVKSGGEAIGDYLASSPTAVAASDYIDANPKLKQGMQEASDDAKAVANLMTMGAGKSLLGDASTATGDALHDWGAARADVANTSHINDLVRPPQTPTEAALSAKNSIVVDGKTIYQHTPHELDISNAVADIPGTGKGLTEQGNLSLIVKADNDEAQSLKATLQKNGKLVDISGSFQPNIDQAIAKATDNPLTVVREGKEAHLGAIDSMNKAILKNMNPDGTLSAAGLLQARKDFDQMLPPRTFTGTSDTVLGNTAKQLRTAMNKTIADADPSAGVAESLRKQTLLKEAADNIAPKAAKLAATPWARAIQKITPHSLTEMGGTGAAMYAAHLMGATVPMIAGPLAAYGIVKGVTAPSTSMMLGKALGRIP